MDGEISGDHEWGLYAGRLLGAGTFLALAYGISTEIALRYAVIIIAVLQLYSIVVAKKLLQLENYCHPKKRKLIVR